MLALQCRLTVDTACNPAIGLALGWDVVATVFAFGERWDAVVFWLALDLVKLVLLGGVDDVGHGAVFKVSDIKSIRESVVVSSG